MDSTTTSPPTPTTENTRRTPSNYLPGYASVKHHEIRTAETDAAYLLPTLVSLAKADPNLRLLDIGAGSGTITSSLAKYIPQGHVTAVDISPEILAHAAAHAAAQGVTNITFQTANVFHLPFEDATFDVVHESQMLCYQHDPIAAMKEMIRVLKPGGVAAIRECDMRMWSFWPQLPGLEDFFRIQLATHEAGGGTNIAGPQLVSWALRAGVPRQHVTMSQGTWCYSEPAERMIWATSWAQRIRTGGVGRKAVELGLATPEQLEGMARAWEEWAERENATFSAMHGQILIRK